MKWGCCCAPPTGKESELQLQHSLPAGGANSEFWLWLPVGQNIDTAKVKLLEKFPVKITPCFLLGLADPVHSAYGLELVSRVEDRLHQQHVSRFDDVQTIGAGVERKEEDVDLFIVFEGAQILLEN